MGNFYSKKRHCIPMLSKYPYNKAIRKGRKSYGLGQLVSPYPGTQPYPGNLNSFYLSNYLLHLSVAILQKQEAYTTNKQFSLLTSFPFLQVTYLKEKKHLGISNPSEERGIHNHKRKLNQKNLFKAKQFFGNKTLKWIKHQYI